MESTATDTVSRSASTSTSKKPPVSAPFPVLSLPNEILSLVFEYISQKDLPESRLVSSDWKDKVDQLANYHFKFHDGLKEETLLNARRQRLRSCEFLGLRKPFNVDDFINPHLIKDILFSSGQSSQNVQNILSTCLDVEKLSFYTTISADQIFEYGSDYSGLFNRLRKLRELDIGIQCFRKRLSAPGLAGEPSRSSIFNAIISNPNIHLQNLRRININFPMLFNEWLELFRFLVRHGSTLRSVKFRCFPCPDKDTVPPSLISELMENVCNLQTLSIIDDGCCDENSPILSVFTSLFSAQKSLEIVKLDYETVPLGIVRSGITRCQKTLQIIELYKVEVGNEPEYWMDGSLFSGCVNLRELIFEVFDSQVVYITFDVELGPGAPESIRSLSSSGNMLSKTKNFQASGFCGLSSHLQKLVLGGCHIPTIELMNLTSKDHCSNLKILELNNVGLAEPYGCNFATFMEILGNLNNLNHFKINLASKSKGDKSKWKLLFLIGKEMGIMEGYCENYRQTIDPYNETIFLNFVKSSSEKVKPEQLREMLLKRLAEISPEEDPEPIYDPGVESIEGHEFTRIVVRHIGA